tara:strand:+ start:13 stop:504 length:492 start_codon:yes stop_codon:yes gene_type:complete
MTILNKYDYLRFFIIAFFIILIDFFSKKWVLSFLFEIPKQIIITPFFNLTPVWNNGISFGLMSSQPEAVRLVVPILAILVVIYLVFQLHIQKPLQQIGSAVIAGGAVGNVIDRILYGKVVDFFDFHISGYHWPAFNIADISICTGVAIWIYVIILSSATIGEK